ncbi:MAG: hydroxymethylglutaryl-CoA lyase [Bacteroidota bacterium]|jgi:hydroxymethylglutaryl-CoA lyase
MEEAKKLIYVECPRDAMQGIKQFIPTAIKINYIKHLLTLGFDVLDCGSFVNPESIPQMADTAEVLQGITSIESDTKLLVIIANERGALRAASFSNIHYLGYPFSISETFQRRNTNASRDEAYRRLAKIQDIAVASNKEVVAYISMAFGNPYGDSCSAEDIIEWGQKIAALGIRTISLADTIGSATANSITSIFTEVKRKLPHLNIGLHLHAKPMDWRSKIEAAYNAGCKRYDGAMAGFGGCPMANDELVGNIPTEEVLPWLLSAEGHSIKSLNEKLSKTKEIAMLSYKGINKSY